MLKKHLTLAGSALLSLSINASAATVGFSINQSFTQGERLRDLPIFNFTLPSGGGEIIIDPGSSGQYLDFQMDGDATFSTINESLEDYYFLSSYTTGDVIDATTVGTHTSIDGDWDTILVDGMTRGVWGASHSGHLGFLTSASQYGYINYDFIYGRGLSTITLNSGAFELDPGVGITAGEVPVPAAAWLFGYALVSLAVIGRKRKTGGLIQKPLS